MANVAAQFIIDKEVAAEIERLEQLKRIGKNFIRVIYTGRNQMPRFQGFETVGITMVYDPDKGKDEAQAVPGEFQTSMVEFRKASDGRYIADVLDSQHNRFVISRHLEMDMEVEDPKLAKEIAALTSKPYVVEPDRKTQLLRERQRIENELASMGESVPPPGRVRGRRARVVGKLAVETESTPVPEPVPVTESGESGG